MSIVCGDCGKDNPYGSRYCNWCGKPFDAVTSPPVTDGKVCPHCGTVNPLVASFCQNCTVSFPVRDAAAHPVSEERQVSRRNCWNCGASVDEHVRLCTACGTEIPPMPEEPPSSRRASEWLLCASILFVGAGLLCLFSAARLLTAEGYFEEYGLDISGMLLFCGALVIIFACCAFFAATMTYHRGSLSLILLAGILSMLGGGPLFLGSFMSLIGIVLVVVKRKELN